jgi:hypothetical protein
MENYMLIMRNRIMDAVMVKDDREKVEASMMYKTAMTIVNNYLEDEIEPTALELSVLDFTAEYYEEIS